MPTKSLRILFQIDWNDEAGTVSRLWDGSGPCMDSDGNIWTGCAALAGLDAVEQAINGEAATLSVNLSGVSGVHSNLVWLSLEEGEIVGSRFRILIQPCDAADQPQGSAQVMFTGTIDNIIFDEKPSEVGSLSSITAEIVNRFTLRRLSRGGVLSDADQKARSAVLNPGGTPDRFCERVAAMRDKTIAWPRWS